MSLNPIDPNEKIETGGREVTRAEALRILDESYKRMKAAEASRIANDPDRWRPRIDLPDWFDANVERLLGFLDLEDGWYKDVTGPDGKRITKKAVAVAIRHMLELYERTELRIYVFPTIKGGICLEYDENWDLPMTGRWGVVEIAPDGVVEEVTEKDPD